MTKKNSKNINSFIKVKSADKFLSTKKGKFILLIISILICLIFALISLFQPAKEFYLSLRQNDKLNAQLESIKNTNDLLGKDIDFIQTEDGIKQRAYEELGLVSQGEQAGAVNGLNDESTDNNNSISTSNNTSSRVSYKIIEAPKTWYSDFCDFIFGVDTSQ